MPKKLKFDAICGIIKLPDSPTGRKEVALLPSGNSYNKAITKGGNQMELKDITGKKFWNLTVIEKAGKQGKKIMWKCQCDCGETIVAAGCNIKSGKIKSCGCRRKRKSRERLSKHGLSGTRIHNVWDSMRQRCTNPKNPGYQNYGGRGIQVCKEWDDFESFYNWAMAHGYTDELTIDRIDVNGNYCPENCRWTTYKVQANNTRTNTWLECRGERHTVAEWSDLTGIKQSTILVRIKKYGWSIEQALFTPVRGMRRAG